MPKYLWTATYATDGVQGLQKGGGTARREAIERLVNGLGGRLEAFYFAFGDDDAYAIVDLPDDAAAAAISMAVNSENAVRLKTVPLLEPSGSTRRRSSRSTTGRQGPSRGRPAYASSGSARRHHSTADHRPHER